jgi:hypothetical protein
VAIYTIAPPYGNLRSNGARLAYALAGGMAKFAGGARISRCSVIPPSIPKQWDGPLLT